MVGEFFRESIYAEADLSAEAADEFSFFFGGF